MICWCGSDTIDPVISVELLPLSFAGLDTPPYNNFVLKCDAVKPSNYEQEIELSWKKDGKSLTEQQIQSEVDYSAEMDTVSSILTISRASVEHSGVYECIATISIPGRSTYLKWKSSNVTIAGKIFKHLCAYSAENFHLDKVLIIGCAFQQQPLQLFFSSTLLVFITVRLGW